MGESACLQVGDVWGLGWIPGSAASLVQQPVAYTADVALVTVLSGSYLFWTLFINWGFVIDKTVNDDLIIIIN